MAAVSFTRDIPTRSLLAGNVGHLTAFEHIQSITVGSLGASSVTFSEIPQDYRHLQIRACITASATPNGTMRMNVNGDNTVNYSTHVLYGTGTTAGSGSWTADSYTQAGYGIQNSTYSGVAIVDILDYANTVKNKTYRTLSGVDTNGGGYVALISGSLRSTAPTTLITFTLQSANFQNYSTFSLYGIR